LVANEEGVPDFQALQNAFESGQSGASIYYLFDLPYLNGLDLREVPLEQRRAALAKVLDASEDEILRFSEDFGEEPDALLNGATLRIISGKWKPLVVFFLRDGPKCYGELKRLMLGVSDKVLIPQLKDLEAEHVLTRTDYKEVPPRVDYMLTPLARSLAEAIVPLCT